MNMWERVIRAVLDSAVVIVLTLSLLWVFLWLSFAADLRWRRKDIPPALKDADTPLYPPDGDGLTPHLHTFKQVEGRRVAVCACGSSIWTSR